MGRTFGPRHALTLLPITFRSPPAEELHEGEDAIAVSAWVLTVGFPVMESGKVKLVMG